MRKIRLLFPLILIMIYFVGCNFNFQIHPDKYYKAYFYCEDVLVETKTIKENELITSIDLEKIITIEGYQFVGWDYNGDDSVDELPIIKEDIVLKAVYREDRKYSVSFYLDDELLSTNSYNLNEEVTSFDEQVKPSDEQYDYTFVGWDCNGDDVAEKFPYKVTDDLKFVALFTKTLVKYDYKMYDGEVLVQEGKVEYGSKINYEGTNYKFVGDKPYCLIGWDANDDGVCDDINSIKSNVILKAIYSDTQLLIMEVDNEVYIEYVLEGERLQLKELDLQTSQKVVWYLDSSYTLILNSNIMPNGNLYLYGRIEKAYTIDTSLLEFTLKDKITSKDDFFMTLDYLLFNRIYNNKVVLDFDCNVDTLIDEAVNASTIDVAYNISTSYNPNTKELEMNFSYSLSNTTSSHVIYEQYDAIGVRQYPNTRGDSFNDFYIDTVNKTYKVSNSEQLYYCLEHGYRPIIDEENLELTSLYQKMKDVLRLIISDDMNDYDKALAIYEWLVMEVTYDKYVFDLVIGGTSASKYHCFYLEGVFNDKLAVCDGISKAYACLANMEGIPCVRVTGTGSVNHAWNKICINNNWYVVDATSGGTIVNQEFEILTHSFFLVTDEYYKNFYLEDGIYFNGIEAKGEFNYYKNYGYTYNQTENDFYCINVSEMTELLKWFASNCKSKNTCEMYIDFDCGDSIKDELGIAQSNAKLYDISYMFDGKVLIILKK